MSLKIGPLLRQCFVTAAVCVNAVGNGCVYGFPAVLLSQAEKPEAAIPLTKEEGSWIASVISITTIVGDLIMPLIMGRLGRLTAHFSVLVTMIAAWVFMIFATNFELLLVGRTLQGLSVGLLIPLRSVLIGEYTSPKYRGAFLVMLSLAQGFGIFFVHLMGSFMHWQHTAIVSLAFPLISFVMTFFIPESPSWLADKGKYEDCGRSFRWLRGNEEDQELNELIQARIKHKETVMADNNDNLFKYSARIIKKKEFYKPITLMLHVYLLMYLAGTVIFPVYATNIIKILMHPKVNAHFWMVQLDMQRIVSNTLAIYVISKVRRRTMMFWTGALSIGSHIAIAAYTYAKMHGLFQYDAVWIPALLLNLQILAVAMGMVPLPGVLAGEIFPLEYRSISGSISTAVASAINFIIVKTFPSLVETIEIYGTYGLYACLIFYLLVVIWFTLPETRGKTLQQIEDGFKGVKKVPQLDDAEKQRLKEQM